MGRRKRSPSNNNHNQNFEVPKLGADANTINGEQSQSDETAEPVDPDDSSKLPPNISIRNSTTSTTSTTRTTRTTRTTATYYDKDADKAAKLDIDISVARAFAATPFPRTSGRPAHNSNSSFSSSSSSSSSSTPSFSSSSPLSYLSPSSSVTTANVQPSTGATPQYLKPSSAPCGVLSMSSLMRKHTSASYNVSQTTATGTTHYAKTVSKSRLSSSLATENPATRSTLLNTPPPHLLLKRYPSDNSSSDILDVDLVIEKLLKMGTQPNGTAPTTTKSKRDFPFRSWEIQLICSHAREIFLEEPSLLRLQAPIKVVGDVHGQFNDLLRILKLSGAPPDTNYLFLGDYVDRGKQSLETILLLLCYKLKYRNNFFMLRGNHESANVTKIYGFYDECKRRMGSKSWRFFVDVFNTLPIAATIQDRIFCVHGGVSPELKELNQINQIMRPTDIPDQGLLTDLLWSDPDPQIQDWSLNDRGVSYTFSKRNVYDICSRFKFDLIIRGHMVVEDGYEFFAKKKLVTVFSAPNYCGEFQNWGAVMSVTTGLMCSFELLKPHSLKNKKTRKTRR
ncbi:uncharacterized protein HLK63_C01353 [Nakaseomyces glabratus]|nr:uncharacterized protein GW608_C01353 [Nakaseomyces glabratus]UCS24438.1 uncharacterized protein HLK63_C01353 [Nakaseomyces glabratus]UCS29668.1 uncharacterized protein HLK64_C01353 [Nakaseomyces glabratus]UCS34897.1 uncharacterized protein HLK62_C01353 [Nakaseomyces glabratus]